MLLVVSHPTIEETKREAALGSPKALWNLERLDRAQREAGGPSPR